MPFQIRLPEDHVLVKITDFDNVCRDSGYSRG